MSRAFLCPKKVQSSLNVDLSIVCSVALRGFAILDWCVRLIHGACVTGNFYLDTAISLAGIAVIVILIRILFPQRSVELTPTTIESKLALDEPDFSISRTIIDQEACAAIVEAPDGEIAVIRQVGVDLAVRRVKEEPGCISRTAGAITVRLSDPGFSHVTVRDGSLRDKVGETAI